MLPVTSRPTMRQSTLLLNPNEAVATSLVPAENIKSVPTAMAGDWPKTSTRIGVINEPPPTPVRPTSAPTNRPQAAYSKGLDIRAAVYPREVERP